jgi:UDP-N-acetyl-D-mannosaminuronic acid transferase (WecB/TagA/CpsF family)
MAVAKPRRLRLGIIECTTHTVIQLLDEVRLLLNNKFLQPRTLLCVNAHIYNIAYKDLALRRIINTARIVAADGISIVIASRLFGTRIPERCNFTEAFSEFIQDKYMPESTGILIGVTEEESRLAAQNINQISTHCRLIETASGFLDEAYYKKLFASFKKIASILCPEAIVWCIGAGTIKIFADTMNEAPVFWRRSGLQWLHRLLSEPATLWQRYLIGNPLFIYRACKQRLQKKRE